MSDDARRPSESLQPTAAATPRPSPSPTGSAADGAAVEPAADWPAIPGYEILDQLEPGGMGVVYRARQVGLNRIVALKMIRTGLQAGPQERARFRVEAEAVASLSHPHVIQIYDFGDWNGRPYLAMEFADGGSLAQRLSGRPLAAFEAAPLLETVARAVQFVHEHGIIHRDLKPANVLFTDQGIAKLADFGLAKRLNQDQGLTRSHAIIGTASYMAPEQAGADRQALGPASDVYALGAILYEVLTGRPPFLAKTPELTIHKVLAEEPLPLRRLRPEVPAELEAICLKCLEKEPARRFASALALAEDLRLYQDGQPISIQSFGLFEWHARLARRAGYEILDSLGTGMLGVVYKARQIALDRTVALKMIAARDGFDPVRLDHLRAEAVAVAQLHHPNVAEVFDFGEQAGEPYIAREYVEGGSLVKAFAGPPRPAEQIAALLETLARAVHHAHSRGIVHGGLKSSKVLVAADGTPKITGFGLARMLPHEPDPAVDVYALGAILYELLAGRPPASADKVEAPLGPDRLGTPEPPRLWRPEVPRDLEAICMKCLEQEPAERYPSAAALAEDLRRFRAGEVLYIADLDDRTQQERWARRAGYEILEVLGRDHEGFTYQVRQLALDRIVVLKRIAARHRFVPAAKSRFRWEAQLLARLRHPSIVQLYDQGEQNDLSFFTREFVDGPTLAEKAGPAPLPIRLAAELVETLALAIQSAHSLSIVHGGLHPGIVRFTPAGVPRITSFRRARLSLREPDDPQVESKMRRVAGYLAPEQLDGRKRSLAPAADIYALGAIWYTLLTGQPPFLGGTLQETLERIRSQAPRPPRHWQPNLPAELEALCLRCLDKHAARRPASAEDLADELYLFRDG